jgi:hypothetical protein
MIGPSDLLSALQNGVIAIQDLTTTIGSVFPQSGTVSSSAPTVGTITFTSSQANGFLLVTTSSGAQYKVPVYPL